MTARRNIAFQGIEWGFPAFPASCQPVSRSMPWWAFLFRSAMIDQIRAIPTEYRGITFRSRLEAKWAAMFDRLEWRWEYEAIDLNGYIPDFILQFNDPVIAEVKPAMTFDQCRQHIPKLERSGWTGEALIFGGALKLGPESFLGPECCLYGQSGGPMGELLWGPGEMHQCLKCGAYSIYHTEHSYRCIVNGCYDGDRFLGPVNFDTVHGYWADSHEVSKYDQSARRVA